MLDGLEKLNASVVPKTVKVTRGAVKARASVAGSPCSGAVRARRMPHQTPPVSAHTTPVAPTTPMIRAVSRMMLWACVTV